MGLYQPRFKRKAKDGTITGSYQARTWSYAFTHPKTGLRIKVATGLTDKRAAEMMFRQAQRRAAEEATGLVSPFDVHEKRPLAEHLADWYATRFAQGVTPKTVKLADRRARAVLSGCGFKTWPDIEASRVQIFIGELRDRGRRRTGKRRGIGPKTRNDYLGAVKQFCRWMVADRRAGDNPLAYLKPEKTAADRRHDRRALDDAELIALLDATRAGPDRLAMTGETRCWLYRLAVETVCASRSWDP